MKMIEKQAALVLVQKIPWLSAGKTSKNKFSKGLGAPVYKECAAKLPCGLNYFIFS